MIDLAAIRRAAGVTQVELASRLDTAQGQISRTEHQSDWLLSTLASYLEALGVEAELVVKVRGAGTLRQRLTGPGEESR